MSGNAYVEDPVMGVSLYNVASGFWAGRDERKTDRQKAQIFV